MQTDWLGGSALAATSIRYTQQAKEAAPSNDDDAEDRRRDTYEREVTVPADPMDCWQAKVDEGATQVATVLHSVREKLELAQASAIAADEAAPITVEEVLAARKRLNAKRAAAEASGTLAADADVRRLQFSAQSACGTGAVCHVETRGNDKRQHGKPKANAKSKGAVTDECNGRRSVA